MRNLKNKQNEAHCQEQIDGCQRQVGEMGKKSLKAQTSKYKKSRTQGCNIQYDYPI